LKGSQDAESNQSSALGFLASNDFVVLVIKNLFFEI